MVETLTRDKFQEFKADYAFYGTHTELDKYRNEQSVVDDEPRVTVNTMWQPITDYQALAEYGRDVSSMLFAIVYEEALDLSRQWPDIRQGDQINIRGKRYEVRGVKEFNTYLRIEVQLVKGAGPIVPKQTEPEPEPTPEPEPEPEEPPEPDETEGDDDETRR